jgi:hypothetical protein
MGQPIPVRNLGKVGVVKDIEPWDLPPEGWSGGVNVRFDDGQAIRAPVFREAIRNLPATSGHLQDAAGLAAFRPPTGYDMVVLLDSWGRADLLINATATRRITETSGFTPNYVDGSQFTSCTLGGVLYICREDARPRMLLPTAPNLVTLPNMDSGWSASILRGFGDTLVAFNVTKSGIAYDNMVKWSDLTLAGGPPGSWDTSDPTTLAGENTPAGMRGGIQDANTLRDIMVIYTDRQIWAMEKTGEKTFVYKFRLIWSDEKYGAISKNCSIEIDGMHYVFGQGDIYRHDGIRPPESLISGLNRRYIFGNMMMSEQRRFFVSHNPQTSEVMFNYVSQDPDIHFPASSGCNRSFVYNYRNNTQSFMDVPCITAAAVANAEAPTPWSSMPTPLTWASAGGTWAELMDNFKPALLVVGKMAAPTLSAARLYALDPIQKNSRVNMPISSQANPPAYLEKRAIDLDFSGAPLGYFKRVNALYPQCRLYSGEAPVIRIGATEFPGQEPVWGGLTELDPSVVSMIPGRASGCYLAIRLDIPSRTDFSVSGFDLDVGPGGRRPTGSPRSSTQPSDENWDGDFWDGTNLWQD